MTEVEALQNEVRQLSRRLAAMESRAVRGAPPFLVQRKPLGKKFQERFPNGTDLEDSIDGRKCDAADNAEVVQGSSAHQLLFEMNDNGLAKYVAIGGAFAVKLEGDGGAAGDSSTECTRTYTVKDNDDDGTVLAEEVELEDGGTRPEKGEMSEATWGIAIWNVDNTLKLLWANERPQSGEGVDVTVITAVRDNGTDKLQYKSRSVTVIAAGDESDWADFAETEECDPPSEGE